MKPTLTLLALALTVLAGCKLPPPPNEQETSQSNISNNYNTILIDGCEYIERKYYPEVPIVHKGNCKNPIHQK